jgi:FkbM family methyltransferase
MKRPEFAVLISKTLQILIQISAIPLRYRAKYRMVSHLIESLDPVITSDTPHGPIKFYCPATWPYSRSNIKGPHMLKWIDSFASGDELWDIGANVGAYSLYAAKRGISVLAFEPAAVNYFVLAKNIEVNGMDDQIIGLNLAIHNENKLSHLFMSRTTLGSAKHSFGREQSESDIIKSDGTHNKHRQSVIGYSIDGFIEQYSPTFPTHIKIDVDGNEELIIDGAGTTFSDLRLKSIVIETRPETYEAVSGKMKAFGLQETPLSKNKTHSGDILFTRNS